MLYGYLNSPFVSNPFSDAAIPPTSLTSPVISGSGLIGQTLSTTNGTWSGTLPITYSYQWNRNGSIIVGATNNTYVLVTADGSTSITCTVKATNAGGFASSTSNAISVAAATDADADAFIAAAAITDTTQKSAIDKLVVDLKGYGIWSKMKAIYPFIGGTAAQHKFNLRSPLDTDAAFRLVFNGGGTHSATGYLPNRINSFGNTKLIPSSILTNNNYHLAYYSRTQNTTGNGTAEMGAVISNNQAIGLRLYDTGVNGKLFYSGPYPTNSVTVSNTDSTGFMIGSRISINSAKMFQDGSLLGTNTATNAGTLPNCEMGLFANNFGSFQSEYSEKECAFSSIGDGLTDTEAANYYTAVQTFQTTLGRNV